MLKWSKPRNDSMVREDHTCSDPSQMLNIERRIVGVLPAPGHLACESRSGKIIVGGRHCC